jgi:hypothetical protein
MIVLDTPNIDSNNNEIVNLTEILDKIKLIGFINTFIITINV